MVLFTTCPGVVWLDSSVPLVGSPMIVWLVVMMVTVEPGALAGADASELSSWELTCSSPARNQGLSTLYGSATTVTALLGQGPDKPCQQRNT